MKNKLNIVFSKITSCLLSMLMIVTCISVSTVVAEDSATDPTAITETTEQTSEVAAVSNETTGTEETQATTEQPAQEVKQEEVSTEITTETQTEEVKSEEVTKVEETTSTDTYAVVTADAGLATKEEAPANDEIAETNEVTSNEEETKDYSSSLSYTVNYNEDGTIATIVITLDTEDENVYLDLKNADDETFNELYESGKLAVNESLTTYTTLAFDVAQDGDYTFVVGVYSFEDGSELASKEFNINVALNGEGEVDTNSEVTVAKHEDITINVGEWTTLKTDKPTEGEWYQTGHGIVAIMNNKIQGIGIGTTTVTHEYKSYGKTIKDTWTITVTDGVADKVKAYVYVNGYGYSDEALKLMGIDPDTRDNNGYFPVGEITVSGDFFIDKDTRSSSLINSDEDWNKLKAALSTLNTDTLTGVYANNKGNKIGEYLNQATGDLNQYWGSGKTNFGYFTDKSYGFDDQSVKYHLDLHFNTSVITYVTGNNGIADGSAKDGTTVGTRTFISGSTAQAPADTSFIPQGYELAGYYTDRNFENEWIPGETKVQEGMTIYVKLVKKGQTAIEYVASKGGTVTTSREDFYTEGGNPKGSTAQANKGYKFAGWYSDEACTKKVSSEVTLVPSETWEAGKVYTYYAKFEEKAGKVGYYLALDGASLSGYESEELVSEDGNKYYYNYGFAKGDTFTVTNLVPTASNAAFIGWMDKARDKQEATIRKAGETVTYIYKNDTYTLDALWASLTATGTTVEYDGQAHGLSKVEITINDSNLDDKYKKQAESLITKGDVEYSTDNVNWSKEAPTFTDANTYKVYVRQTVTVGGQAYTLTANADVVITKAKLSVTTESASKLYDGKPLTAGGEVTGLKNNETVDFVLTGSQTKVGSSDNTYTLTFADQEGASEKATAKSSNYEIENVTVGKLDVTESDALTIKAADASKQYDGTALTGEATANIEGAEITYSKEPSITNAGELEVTATATLEGYKSATTTFKLTVTKKSITVTAQNAGKKYNEADPTLEAKVTGLVKGDTFSNYTVTRAEGEDVGTYKITVSGAEEIDNYTITYVPATFTISESDALTIKAADASKQYDGTALTGEATANIEGAEITYSKEPSITNAGELEVTATATLEGYKSATTTFKLTVTKKSVTVKADNKEKTYGANDPDLTATVEGLVEGDSLNYSLSREEGEDVGEYVISVELSDNPNYEVEATSGYLTINPAEATITVNSYEKTKGESDPTLGATVTGTVNGESLEYTLSREDGEDVGEYTITAKLGENKNYKVTVVDGKLTIKEASTPTPAPTPDNNNDDNYEACPTGTYWNEATQSCVTRGRVNPTPTPDNGGSDDSTPTNDDTTPDTEPIDDNDTPEVNPTPVTPETIDDDTTPEKAKGSWALVNLLSVCVSFLLGIILLLSKNKKDDDEEEENNNDEVNKTIRHKRWKVVAVVDAIAALIIFILTENMTLPMALVDKWTLLMLALVLVSVVSLLLGRKYHEDDSDEEAQNA